MQVRLARPEDGEAIRAIYNLEVTTSTVTMDLVPRTSQDQRRWHQERSGAHAVIVAGRQRTPASGDTSIFTRESGASHRTVPANTTE